MPEAAKQYLSVENFKLFLILIPILIGGLAAWGDMRVSVASMQTEVRELQKDSTEVKALTEAVRELTITSARLEERLRTLDRRLSGFE